jgi:hypothetical protein
MNHIQNFDVMIDELWNMHNQNLIYIVPESIDQYSVSDHRYFHCHYTKEIKGLTRRRKGYLYIVGDSFGFSIEHLFKINTSFYRLMFPYSDPFVFEHLRETFHEWVLNALTLPVHERELNFQAFLEKRKFLYTNARILARSHLPGIPNDVGEMISNFIPRIQQ